MLKVEIIGHLGADAELRENDRGKFITFQVYHSERFVDRASGEIIERTARASVTKNGDLGNLLQYMKKGFQVYVRGDLELRTYLGNDNLYHAGMNIRATELEPLWEKKQSDPVQEVVKPL